MVSITRVRTLGGSLAVTLPRELVKEKGLKEDEMVEIEVKKHKENFFGVIKEVGSFVRKDRMEDRE